MNSYKETCTKIYENWKKNPGYLETSSGAGSTVISTINVRKIIEGIITKYNIKQIVDCSCGDFNWQRLIKLNGSKYYGIDVVNERVKINKEKYESDDIKFRSLNVMNSKIRKKCDLLICRSILLGMTYEEAIEYLNNALNSNPDYVLLTTFPELKESNCLKSHSWGAANIELDPFGFTCVEDIYKEEDPKLIKTQYKNKSLVLLKGKNLKSMVSRRFKKIENQ